MRTVFKQAINKAISLSGGKKKKVAGDDDGGSGKDDGGGKVRANESCQAAPLSSRGGGGLRGETVPLYAL